MLVATLVLLPSCVINSDKYLRPRDLAPPWHVDRTRILGVRATPAEIAPGQRATFEALIGTAHGEDPDLGLLWLACPEEGAGCTTDLGGIDLETASPDQLAEIGFIGFEPGLPPAYTAPADLLDDLSDDDRLEGLSILVQLTAFPIEQLDDPEALEALDFNLIEAGYKRLVVSEATTPNNNPVLATFLVDGLPVPLDAEVVVVTPEQGYDLGIVLDDAAGRETYEFVNSDGVLEERIEEPYATWYSTGGEVLEPVTLWPYMEATWTAPAESGAEGTWFTVVRDRRGGMSWWTQPWRVL